MLVVIQSSGCTPQVGKIIGVNLFQQKIQLQIIKVCVINLTQIKS